MEIIIRRSKRNDKNMMLLQTIRKSHSVRKVQVILQYMKMKSAKIDTWIDIKNENWNDPTTAGFFSRWITWNKPTLTESLKDTNKRFKNIKT